MIPTTELDTARDAHQVAAQRVQERQQALREAQTRFDAMVAESGDIGMAGDALLIAERALASAMQQQAAAEATLSDAQRAYSRSAGLAAAAQARIAMEDARADRDALLDRWRAMLAAVDDLVKATRAYNDRAGRLAMEANQAQSAVTGATIGPIAGPRRSAHDILCLPAATIKRPNPLSFLVVPRDLDQVATYPDKTTYVDATVG